MGTHKFLFGETTSKLIKIASDIYYELGYGHPERVYQKAFSIQLDKAGLSFKREKYAKILYDGQVAGRYFLDFLVDGNIAVELKVRREIYESDWIQLLNYLKAENLRVGLVIVFAKDGLKLKRVVN